MNGKAISCEEARFILRLNGYELARQGKHEVWKNKKTGEVIAITRRLISQKTWKRECKNHNLKELEEW